MPVGCWFHIAVTPYSSWSHSGRVRVMSCVRLSGGMCLLGWVLGEGLLCVGGVVPVGWFGRLGCRVVSFPLLSRRKYSCMSVYSCYVGVCTWRGCAVHPRRLFMLRICWLNVCTCVGIGALPGRAGTWYVLICCVVTSVCTWCGNADPGRAGIMVRSTFVCVLSVLVLSSWLYHSTPETAKK